MRGYYPRVYRSFEEFEREELRRGTSLRASVDEMLDEMFAEELDFDLETRAQRGGFGEEEEDG